jgi:cell pole-organizing protein PopZ
MGDISTEPSMEEILSSIKRIIAEEGDAAVATRTRRGSRTGAAPSPRADVDEVLELSEPVLDEAEPATELPVIAQEKPMPMGTPTPPEPAQAKPILSERAAEATRGPLEALSRMVVKPEVTGSDTLEGLVRELLKPMLSEWLDANLPQVVESMVAKEISRITGRD